jgi:hypothetical protein
MKQVDILRAYSAASGDGAFGVANEAVARIVGLSASTVSLANPFFADVGLIERKDGGNAPVKEVVDFARAFQWDASYAGTELGPLLRSTWFGSALMPRLEFGPLSEGDAIRELDKAAVAGTDYRSQLRTLLDYLELGHLIVRNGDMVEADRDAPVGKTPAETPPKSEPGEVKQAVPGGPLPLLIQGLLQELPRGKAWTRAQAKRWLDLAGLTFEMVYDFEDEPASGEIPNKANKDSREREGP